MRLREDSLDFQPYHVHRINHHPVGSPQSHEMDSPARTCGGALATLTPEVAHIVPVPELKAPTAELHLLTCASEAARSRRDGLSGEKGSPA